jgi:hypothetical protein
VAERHKPTRLAPAELVHFVLSDGRSEGMTAKEAYQKWQRARDQWLAAHPGMEDALGTPLENLRHSLPWGVNGMSRELRDSGHE